METTHTDPAFTSEDLADAARMETLGPAYFAARRMAEALMQGATPEPLKIAADKVTKDIRDALYEYVEGYLLVDLEMNLQGHICRMVDATVNALLTGDTWAMSRYPYHRYSDGAAVRAAVCKHGGEHILSLRIADLEKEVAELKQSLSYERAY